MPPEFPGSTKGTELGSKAAPLQADKTGVLWARNKVIATLWVLWLRTGPGALIACSLLKHFSFLWDLLKSFREDKPALNTCLSTWHSRPDCFMFSPNHPISL